jgi:hypothetical protein
MRQSGAIDEKTMRELDALAGKQRPDELTRIAGRLNDALADPNPSELSRVLASEIAARVAGVPFWTNDKNLAKVAGELRLNPSEH